MDVGDVAAFRDAAAVVDSSSLTDRERVELVAELERVKGAVAAAQARLTHALRRSREAVDARDVARSVGSEVALARRCSPTLGDRFVGLSRALVEEMPATMAALSSGVCSERHAVVLVHATSVLSLEDRREVDRRVGPLLGRLGVVAAERAARRVGAELDAAAVVRRMEDAVRSRRVTVRPAPDGMAYLTVLGPMVEVVGAHAALLARSRSVVGGRCPDEAPGGRGVGAVAADTALRVLSGRRSSDDLQPLEVHVVMTDRSLLGTGDPGRSVMEPARIPGHGSVPAPVVRSLLRGAPAQAVASTSTAEPGDLTNAHAGAEASVWLRRLYTTPDGRDLVAMDSRRRLFTGLLRRMLVLRDDTCTTPWCGAPIVHADHLDPARDGGPTSFANGNGACARCNHVKEAPGWSAELHDRAPGTREAGSDGAATADREVVLTSAVGVRYASQPPPLLGWGSETAVAPRAPGGGRASPRRRGAVPTAHARAVGRPRPRRRDGDRRPTKRPLLTSRLERELCRYLR